MVKDFLPAVGISLAFLNNQGNVAPVSAGGIDQPGGSVDIRLLGDMDPEAVIGN